jgi:RNA polymerase sigma-70 factor (ECF subfamily)
MKPFDEKRVTRQLADKATRRSAFEEVVNHYSQPLYWKIRQIVLTHEDADDVLQNTFMKAWLNLDDFKQISKLSTWLHRIAINESLDLLRRRKTRQDKTQDIGASVSSQLMSDDYFDGDQLHALLQEAVASLPDVQRTVFCLRYFDDMKYSDISQILQTTEGALKASYHIAVQKIKTYMTEHE